MADEKTFKTFKEFWPEYLRLHSRPATRAVHYAGTLAGIGLAIAGAATGALALVALAPVVTYGILFPSHFVFERNNPATFKNPFMSVGGDFKLLFCFLTGRIRSEYEKAGLDFTGKTGNNKNTQPAQTKRRTATATAVPCAIAQIKTKLGTAFNAAKNAVKRKTPAQKAAPAAKANPVAPKA